MAVKKLYNGHYQARVLGPDGRYLTRVFPTKADAKAQEDKWKREKRMGMIGTVEEKNITVDEFFWDWFQALKESTSKKEDTGWRRIQQQLYRDFIFPVIGNLPLKSITPQQVKWVMNEMAKRGRSNQTRRHVFNMLRKMYRDAIEDYQYVVFNPVLRKLKPAVHTAEAPHLQNVDQIKRLLRAAEGKFFELAVWVQVYAGLRIGEMEALRWSDVDLEAGTLSVRRTYVRQTNQIREYPKGKKQFTLVLPPELWAKLREAKRNATSEYVAPSMNGGMLQYKSYFRGLRQMCKEAGLPKLGTHGLRHTTSALYRKHGASKEDMRELYAHSSTTVTERYLHGEGTSLQRVARQIRLFDDVPPSSDPTPQPPENFPVETNKKRTKFRLIRCS